jgi:large subunit ribosomal protein L35
MPTLSRLPVVAGGGGFLYKAVAFRPAGPAAEFSMPKLRTKRAAAKRFGFTGTGKVKRNHAYHRHNMTDQPKKAKVRARGTVVVALSDVRMIRRMLPYGG